jgi:type I restriction enzyme R subunit
MPTEADTCRKFVVPKLQAAEWDNEPYSIAEQRTITDGRIVPVGKGFIRRAPKRVDYLLRYRRDFVLAVVEAKPEYKTAADGLQQAKRYAEMQCDTSNVPQRTIHPLLDREFCNAIVTLRHLPPPLPRRHD